MQFSITPETPETLNNNFAAKVFFNHFSAIKRYIASFDDRYELCQIAYYNRLASRGNQFDVAEIKKLLWNAWSTEQALRIGTYIDNADYYRYALHWSFPQAYYSAYLSLKAFQKTQGCTANNHDGTINQFNQSVISDHYPQAINFYAKGAWKETAFCNLNGFSSIEEGFNGAEKVQNMQDAKNQLAMFLKSTREQNAKAKRARIKSSDKRFHSKKGNTLAKLSKAHWDIIYGNMPCTSIMNLLYRLRIKANYHDVETFVNTDVDFKKFHEHLVFVVDYVNFIHEAYLARVMGNSLYEDILDDFPLSMSSGPKQRFEQHICQ